MGTGRSGRAPGRVGPERSARQMIHLDTAFLINALGQKIVGTVPDDWLLAGR